MTNPAPPPGPGPTHFPAPWASDWGEDRFGLWQALTYRAPGVPLVSPGKIPHGLAAGRARAVR